MPKIEINITHKNGKQSVAYSLQGIQKEAALGYLEMFKAFLTSHILKKNNSPEKPAETLEDVAQGKPIIFTRDDTRFTDEMMPLEFKFIRKKLKKSIAQFAKLLNLPQAAITRFENDSQKSGIQIRVTPSQASLLRTLFDKHERKEKRP